MSGHTVRAIGSLFLRADLRAFPLSAKRSDGERPTKSHNFESAAEKIRDVTAKTNTAENH